MVGIDTNVVVRFLTKDDQTQYREAMKLFSVDELFIPDSVILETEWVLRFAYRFSPAEIAGALRKLFGLPNVRIDNGGKIFKAIAWHEQGLDFADALHLANCDAFSELITFDNKFIKRAKGKSHCQVRKP
jgi:predicted nucleic-acid-binding protein